ncbi:MAG: pyridoxamine 5'-phosphate oxidase family protein [Spirochaetaceae bacterium]|jgi:predicted pyridoxine 5'-phosphate oxidase superfamily flavin-nucleotide-binding protein|nr:pyridoxamine 5'-phosphate oxidase family protein [Spirochaetaceae bacterium]
MVITDEVKRVVEETAFLSLVTVNADGTPHPIIAGKGTVSGDTVVFGIYKMEITQANLLKNKNAWVVGATFVDGKPKGIRLAGTAEAQEKRLIFTASAAEPLI